jgi:hypothetical protein
MTPKPAQWISDYSKAVKRFTFDHDPTSHQPFDAFLFYPLYFELWLDQIHDLVLKLQKRKISPKQASAKLLSYGSLRFMFYAYVNMMGYFDYDKIKAKVILDYFIAIISSKTADKDLFNENKILLRSNKELKPEKNALITANKEDKQLVSRLAGVLALYNHALYNDYSTEQGYTIEGPYQVGKKQLLIRHFPNLKPTTLWANLKVKYKNIKIIALYNTSDLKMRFSTTHIVSTSNYQSKLEKFKVEVNGRPAKDLAKIVAEFAELTSELYLKQKQLSFEQTKKLFLKQQTHELKPLFDLVKMDWKPTANILKAVKNKKLKSKGIIKMHYPKTKQEYEDYVGVTYLKQVYNL